MLDDPGAPEREVDADAEPVEAVDAAGPWLADDALLSAFGLEPAEEIR